MVTVARERLMAKQTMTVREVAEQLGVKPGWVRKRIADGTVTPLRVGGKSKGRYLLRVEDVAVLQAAAALRAQKGSRAVRGAARATFEAADTAALARVSQLEEERANLLAQVAWARAVAQEQQKALEHERQRADRLEAELSVQRGRVEALKALTVWDRLRGRHREV
ncbi:MAG: hypothetical protein N3B11_03430 [Coriobacteriia bacterium]|nr:hypothetical protein [Coriobacteriia bacterium]